MLIISKKKNYPHQGENNDNAVLDLKEGVRPKKIPALIPNMSEIFF
jgi:hypothetical protein